MSCREPEDDFAGAVIDSLKFAGEGDCIAGKVALSRLPRLADQLLESSGWLDCEVQGIAFDGVHAGQPGLRLSVRGVLKMRCQRCLAEVDVACDVDRRLLLIAAGAATEAWPEDELESDDFDAIPASRELSLLALVEEEVLLALPLVPRHADCVLPGAAGAAGKEQESKPSPFAALAGLKKH
jgi:uncharacterized protein